ncbi:uncharacterized protein [Argopecten irradians]|uniref:uncharacterized protein isoform X1 n=1 Tax=Argopecten irradians TaxID=31199 RepID=UPI00371FD52B
MLVNTQVVEQGCLIVIIFLLPGVLMKEVHSPPEGFKFNCGLDICYYPRHFCNIHTQHCETCTSSACNELGVSSQCQRRCTELKDETDISLDELQYSFWRRRYYQLSDQVSTLSYAVWTLVILFCLFVLFHIVKWLKTCKNRMYQKHSSDNHDDKEDRNTYQLIPTAPLDSLASHGAHSHGSSVSVHQPSPSDQDGNYSTMADDRLLHDTIPESPPGIQPSHPRSEQLQNGISTSIGLGWAPSLKSTNVTSLPSNDVHDTTVVKQERRSKCSDSTSDDVRHLSQRQNKQSNDELVGISAAYLPTNVGHKTSWLPFLKSSISNSRANIIEMLRIKSGKVVKSNMNLRTYV